MVNFKNGETPINDINLNKLQTDLQANIDNLSESYDIKKTTGSSATKTYTLLARYELNGDYVDCTDTLLLSGAISSSNSATILNIAIRKNQNNSYDLTRSKYMSSKITNTDIILLSNYDENNNKLTVDVYLYNAATYLTIEGKTLKFTASSEQVKRIYYTNQPIISVLPNGIQYVIPSNQIESGSNNYGNWTKFPDGTMICTRTISININVSTTWGSLFYGSDNTYYEFAQAFIEPPTLQLTFLTDNFGAILGSTGIEPVVERNKFRGITLYRGTSASGVTGKINVTAIGKWK